MKKVDFDRISKKSKSITFTNILGYINRFQEGDASNG